MQSDKSPYDDSPAHGLPASLIQLEGNTVAWIALMQRKAGLNRERRRELQAGAKTYGEVASSVTRAISKTDWNVLTFYLSAGERLGSFSEAPLCASSAGSRNEPDSMI